MTGRSGAELDLGRGTEKGREEEGSADNWVRSVGEREEAAAMRNLLGPCAGAA